MDEILLITDASWRGMAWTGLIGSQAKDFGAIEFKKLSIKSLNGRSEFLLGD